MRSPVDRRMFLNSLGVTMGAAAAATAGSSIIPATAETTPPKGKIPDAPLKMGHMTFLTGPAAVLGEPVA
jgi:branched-chain amino acid transport system substrate-binding protein